MVEVKLPISKIDKIYHVSDVHIRNLKRHSEYQHVFENLYTEIKKDTNNAIIYLAGDIVHAKTDISPELVDIVSKFINSLSNIAPVIIITGNHDCNLNNKNRLDALSPIIDNLQNKNVFYLKKSDIYRINDIDFIVFSRLDDPSLWPSIKDSTAKTKIALYHGVVDGAISDTGFKMGSEKVNVKFFNGADYVLLGDIHKFQYLNESKTIAYASSLIQQNHGESIHNHGIIKWDLVNKTSEFISIHNDYGFYTLRVKEGNIFREDDIPKKPRFRVFFEDTATSDIQRIITDIKRKYKVQDLVISSINSNKLENGLSVDCESLVGNIYDINYQNELLLDFIRRNYGETDEEILKEVIEINNRANSNLLLQDSIKNFKWALKYLEFSNMFSYGEDNRIDFSDMRGVYGLFASNTSGKSSLIDCLLFCLFDKCSRSFKASEILNKDKNDFFCKVCFEINGDEYFIERHGKRDKVGNVPVSVSFWKTENGEYKSLNGEQRRDTNKNIEQHIGVYETFILTAVSIQNDNTAFINMTQSGRKDLLASFLGLDIFESLLIEAKKEVSEVEAIIKEFRKQDLTTQLAEIENSLEINQEEYCNKKSLLKTKQERIEEINNLLILLTSKIKSTTDLKLDIDILNLELSNLKIEKSNISDKISEANNMLVKIEEVTPILFEEYNKFNFDEINNKIEELRIKVSEKNNLSIELANLQTDIKHKREKLEKLKNLEYDENCSYCMNNIFVKDAIETKDSFDRDLLELDNKEIKINKINTEILELDKFTELKERSNEIQEKINKLKELFLEHKNLVELLNSKTELVDTKITDTEKNINIYYENIEVIKGNKSITDNIEDFKSEKLSLTDECNILSDEVQHLHSEIKVNEKDKSNIIDLIGKLKQLENKYQAYQYYISCTIRDGIPYELMSRVVPVFEYRINEVLSQICDFNILLNVDQKNIDAFIVYNNKNPWPLNLSSGMEKFVSSIAIRNALCNISNIPRPNFLIIDEGFGNLDADNIAGLPILFNYLKLNYDFLLIVSHLEIMRDMIDNLIEIKKVDGFSKIES